MIGIALLLGYVGGLASAVVIAVAAVILTTPQRDESAQLETLTARARTAIDSTRRADSRRRRHAA